ncbi:hypothetical protein PAXRUDRAFT_157995, partial [Paxillus rubicundulus Ve08.2h10]
VFRSRSAYHHTDLPPPCQDQCHWRKILIPTVLLWCGSQTNIWKLTDAKILLPALTEIFTTIYPNVKYKVSAQGSIYGVVVQHVIEWRSNFGSTALAIMNDFFTHNKDIDIMDLATSLLQKCMFVYEHLDKPVKSEAFRSAFILQLLATAHVHSTVGYADVPALDTERLAACGITAALSACAAAIKHSLICICDGAFVTEDVLSEATGSQFKHGKARMLKSLNVATGKESTTRYAFSMANWEDSTLPYVQSISTRGDNDLQTIMAMARTILKKQGPDSVEKYLSSTSQESGEEVDERVLLW